MKAKVTVDFEDDRERVQTTVSGQILSDLIENALDDLLLIHDVAPAWQITVQVVA